VQYTRLVQWLALKYNLDGTVKIIFHPEPSIQIQAVILISVFEWMAKIMKLILLVTNLLTFAQFLRTLLIPVA